ncbi:SapC family protein [Aureimonas ureilytica]|uniref:SapC family protein n=1 Tax=Aureimonas ureilytica TaxID=401562 RepID=UPI00036A3C4C|nr:SapC family protein [Aureimonas ureilytica]
MSDAPAIHPLSRERHKGIGWRRFGDYRFAASASFAPLADAELAKAVLHLPLGFVEQAGRWQFVALLGLLPGRNLFVAPDGRWLAGYVPAHLRSYPFRIGRAEGSEDAVFCVDESSGLLVQNGGEALFDGEGQLTQAAAGVWNFMLEVAKGEARLSAACGRLAEAGLIEPWPLALREGEATKQVDGLFRINEGKLNELGDEAFTALRRTGALPVAYAQLFSMGHFEKLGELSDAHAQAAASAQAAHAARRESEARQGPQFTLGNNLDIDWSKVTL